ncbi:MAG: EamA family transporter [Thermoplasmata archaeon]|nr:EamA family transporter [Thermoplasmata archaeon]NIS11412.1 EamA family transporter [Thermoplasmata archaeon]NIS19348.1 EamA family transporter [Thermoplasmata archaeon]NIT76441.1 EamA family transporter [Thermoplasmata archaeon]NIU48476.1 EamA family transporter [Thermoplasmata archaeon]
MASGDGLRKAQGMTMMAGVLWGTSFVVIQWGLDDGFHPMLFLTVRMLIAFASALVVARLLGGVDAWLLRDPWVWALGLSNTAGFVFQYFALDLTVATKAALITNLSLIFVAPMSYVWLREGFTPIKVGALVAVVPGVFLLTTGGDMDSLRGSEFLGDMLSLGAGLSWAFYIIISKHVLRDERVMVSRLTLWVMGTTAVFTIPLGVATIALGDDPLSQVGNVGWATAVYTGVVCSTGAYLLWTRGLKGVTATVSAILLLVMVIVAAVMDYAFLGTEMNAMAWTGAGILLVAMVLVNLEGSEEG